MANRKTTKLALDAMRARNGRSEVEYMKHYKRAYYTTITKPKIEQKRKKLRYRVINAIILFLKKHL